MQKDVPAATLPCKICGSLSRIAFGLPHDKKSGHPIPEAPDDCWFYECSACEFLFTPVLDQTSHEEIYDETYWTQQDPAWFGRVGESLRLVGMANELLGKRLDRIDILDFGCGSGGFVDRARNQLQMNAWGTDINPPPLAREWFLPDLGERKFDVIIACEVIEHLPDPLATFRLIRKHLKHRGVFAFQTAEWNPRLVDRGWWYLGPGNGHISHFSYKSLKWLFRTLGGGRRRMWRGYPGCQAWLFSPYWF